MTSGGRLLTLMTLIFIYLFKVKLQYIREYEIYSNIEWSLIIYLYFVDSLYICLMCCLSFLAIALILLSLHQTQLQFIKYIFNSISELNLDF